MAALINRSLTTVRTELEFLYDSDVIDKKLFDALVAAIPPKYVKDAPAWGIDRLKVDSADLVASKLASTTLDEKTEYIPPAGAPEPKISYLPPPGEPQVSEKAKYEEQAPIAKSDKPIGYCKALYGYEAQQDGDLTIEKGDFIAVVEHLSPDWWKGYKRGNATTVGVFPSNYVTVISDSEFSAAEKARPPAYQPPPQQGYLAQPQQGYLAQPQAFQGYQQGSQPSYGGYAQFPPPLVGYYPQQQQQQQQQAPPQEQQPQQNHLGSQHFKKFGSKLGNAAIFGAGATIGSDIVNLIF